MKRSPGVALITVILAVALVAAITSAMIARQHMDIRRTGHIIHANQSYQYARGVEIWAMQLLARDLLAADSPEEAEGTDHPGEEWAQPLPPTEIHGGSLSGRIEDLQGRFNLNNLMPGAARDDAPDGEGGGEGGGEGETTPAGPSDSQSASQIAIFQRLLKHCQLAPELVWAVVDWLDADTSPSYPNGAEDYAYLGLESPYRAANTAMADPSELSLVLGFDYDAYVCLAPLISALPAPTPINVNTAPVAIFMTLTDDITETHATALAGRRETEPYRSVDDFLGYASDIGVALSATDAATLGVASHYYRAVAHARAGNIRMRLSSRLERLDDGTVRVLSRSRGRS